MTTASPTPGPASMTTPKQRPPAALPPPSAVELPLPRMQGSPYAVVMVCLGNICRSPMAQVVLTEKLLRLGLAGQVTVRSCGTGDWHVGQEMDPRASATLKSAGYDPTLHRASHFDASWLDAADVLLVMDRTNLQDVCGAAPDRATQDRVLLFRCFDPVASDNLDVPDPWYGEERGFQTVLDLVERTTDALAEQLQLVLRREDQRT